MSSDWMSKVAETLLPLSQEQQNIVKALREWKFTGDVIDFSSNDDDKEVNYEEYPPCELCGYPHIKTGYMIKNVFTGEELTIGCECIKKFSPEKEVDESHVLKCLNKLRWKRCKVNISSLEEYYQEEGAFTPKQLILVLNLFKKYNILYTPSCFKMKMRRDHEKSQLESLSDKEWDLIFPCLSPAQRRRRAE
ncbi:hypothetical protein [Methanoculleus sp.]|uniref:hypothetical protein n=1 Tax=Methanoculleus sp. TaxID=90427 RepID=UPI001BD1D92A|nr:hypothetical protein [Methanoculleus sp.]